MCDLLGSSGLLLPWPHCGRVEVSSGREMPEPDLWGQMCPCCQPEGTGRVDGCPRAALHMAGRGAACFSNPERCSMLVCVMLQLCCPGLHLLGNAAAGSWFRPVTVQSCLVSGTSVSLKVCSVPYELKRTCCSQGSSLGVALPWEAARSGCRAFP